MKKTSIAYLIIFFSLKNVSCFSQHVYNWATNPGGNGDDWTYGLAVDGSSNTYITGFFTGTANFDPSGSAYLTANGGQDIFIAKYNTSGNYLWGIHIGGTGQDVGQAIAVDATGNCYVTGSFQGTADFDPGSGTANLSAIGNNDIFLAKYNSSGALLWAESFGSLNNDKANGIAVDASGNVYITGDFWGSADFDASAGTSTLTPVGVNGDLFFAKYNSSGAYVWARSIGSLGADIGRGIAVDASGNVYVTGEYSGTADFDPASGTSNLTPVGNQDIFFAKYTSTGNLTFAKGIGSIGADEGYGIAVDATGNIYLTGYFNGTADFNPASQTNNLVALCCAPDIFFAKYSTTGSYVFAKNIGVATTDQATSLSIDASGNIYLTGFFWSGPIDFDPGAGIFNMTAGSYDGFVAEYNSSGAFVWAADLGGSGFDYGQSIAVDALSNIYVSGTFQNTVDFDPSAAVVNKTSHGSYDNFIVKYGPVGPLPVELISFKGIESNNINHLYWTTASEINNDYFNVERSLNGIEFETIGTVAGNGNSTQTLSYEFDDIAPFARVSYYRLKQVDYNGAFHYSQTIGIRNNQNGFRCFVYNGEESGKYILNYSLAENGIVTILNAYGKVIRALKISGSSEIKIDLIDQSPGIYILRISESQFEKNFKLVNDQ